MLQCGADDCCTVLIEGTGCQSRKLLYMGFVPALLATAMLWVLQRFVRRPVAIFRALGIAALLLSLIPVATLPVVLAAKLFLGAMHVVAGWGIVGLLSR